MDSKRFKEIEDLREKIKRLHEDLKVINRMPTDRHPAQLVRVTYGQAQYALNGDGIPMDELVAFLKSKTGSECLDREREFADA